MSYSLRKNLVELYRGGFFKLPLKLTLFNVGIVLAAFYSAKYIPVAWDDPKVWFQRSGALVTLATIWVEVKLLNKISEREVFNEVFALKVSLSNHIQNFHVSMIGENEFRKANQGDVKHIKAQTKNRANFFNIVIFLNMLVGTLIWAYGDIIFSFFC